MEEQDQPSVSVKDLLARMGKEESDVVLGGRSRRRRSGENSVSVGDLTGEIPVVRDGAPRTHRAEQAGRKWSGWSKREDPDAHLDERDREWDFRVLSGEIERVQDDEDANGTASDEAGSDEDLLGGPSIYRESPKRQEPPAHEVAEEDHWGASEQAEPETAASKAAAYEEATTFTEPVEFEGLEDRPEHGEAESDSAEAVESAHSGWGEAAQTELEDSEHHSSFAEPEAPAEPEQTAAALAVSEAEHGAVWHEESTPKPHKRISAFKADQLERAREVIAKRKSHGEPIHRSGVLGALDKLVAVKLPTWASITLQFVSGFLVGAVLFWVFRQLWRLDQSVFATILALITIVFLVLGARWVRRKNDWAVMAVAGLVGVWVCFGPLAVSLLGR